MKAMRISAGLAAMAFILIGFLFMVNDRNWLGPVVFLSGAIIFAAFLISSAIAETPQRE